MPSADLPGVRVHYRLDGPPDGPVVVLSNSLGTDLSLWAAQVPALVAAGARVLRYDQRGHGRSSAPPGPYTIGDLGGDVLALLDHLGLYRVAVAGVSLGGMTGQWVAARAPQRVAALALCCTAAHLPPASGWTERAEVARTEGMEPIAAGAAERWFTPAFVAARPDVVDGVLRVMRACDRGGYAACCEALGGMDLRPELAAITAPTLVVAAADDPATPPAPHGRELAAGIAGSRLVVVDDASHLAVVERADVVTPLLVGHLLGSGRRGP